MASHPIRRKLSSAGGLKRKRSLSSAGAGGGRKLSSAGGLASRPKKTLLRGRGRLK